MYFEGVLGGAGAPQAGDATRLGVELGDRFFGEAGVAEKRSAGDLAGLVVGHGWVASADQPLDLDALFQRCRPQAGERPRDMFFRFYMDTGGRKWGAPYLNREFFQLLHERMADRCLLILALDDGHPIAGALNLIGSDTIFGRYWGREVERPFLHFEICYYQAIEAAIRKAALRPLADWPRRRWKATILPEVWAGIVPV